MKQLIKCNNMLISTYLIIMLGIFPLYYRYQYSKMGDSKYNFFLYSSSVFVILFVVLFIWRKICEYRIKKLGTTQKKKREFTVDTKPAITLLDKAVFIYFICVVLSFLCSAFKEDAFWGASGWSMGLLSQFLFVSVYFILAREWDYEKWALRLLLVSSAFVFIIAIFHRFDVDLLPIYGNLKDSYKVEFLSTMGQASWYSSFLCTVFPVGLFMFFSEEDKIRRKWAGVFSVFAMMTLVTQNTDSAFMSLAAVLAVLFYLSFEKKQKEFFETVILILGSFCTMGIFQRLFADRMIPIDKLSLFMSQSIWMWVLLIVVLGSYLWLYRKVIFVKNTATTGKKKKLKKPEAVQAKIPYKWFWVLFGIMAAVAVSVIVFVVLNTNGFLLNRFGYRSDNNYLLFNENWGNNRGFSWIFTVRSFGEFAWFRKLIGVGPDCFSAYVASIPEYLQMMNDFWGNRTLTNAHNEYLTKIYNLGIVGLISYLFMLVTAFVSFIKSRNDNPLLPAFSLCVVSYMAHNIFCYEQACCTPVFYILLGIGSNLIHNLSKKSTY